MAKKMRGIMRDCEGKVEDERIPLVPPKGLLRKIVREDLKMELPEFNESVEKFL